MKNYLLVLLILILDQVSKYFIRVNEYSFGIINFVKNTGAGFGILQGQNSYLLFVSLIVLGLILFYWDKLDKKEEI